MVSTEYRVAYYEVFQILKHISNVEYEKLPRELVAMIKEVASEVDDVDFVYNPRLTLVEQGVTPTARTIISILYKNYWTDDITRKTIDKMQKEALEKMKTSGFNPEDVIKNNGNQRDKIEENMNGENETTLAVLPEESFFRKIINKIKSFFMHEDIEIDEIEEIEDTKEDRVEITLSIKNQEPPKAKEKNFAPEKSNNNSNKLEKKNNKKMSRKAKKKAKKMHKV